MRKTLTPSQDVVADRLATLFGRCALCADRPQFVRVSRKRGSYAYKVDGKTVRVPFDRVCAACDQEIERADDGESSLFVVVRRSTLHTDALTYRASWRTYVLALVV